MPGNLRYYQEAPVFDAFTCFDPQSGKLTAIEEDAFGRAKQAANLTTPETAGSIARHDGDGITLFTGATDETRTRFPRRIYFQITRNCNLECPYCFLKARPGWPHAPTAAVVALAAYLGRNGLMEVRLTGGEPTTHPDFFRIVEAFRKNGVFVSIATNGLFSLPTLDRIAEMQPPWIICSVDGNRETHNIYRPDTFDRILANLRLLKNRQPALKLRLTTVLTRRNMGQIRDLAEIAGSVGADSITIIPLRPQVRNPAILADMINAQEFKNVLEQIVRVSEATGVRMSTTLATDLEGHLLQDPIVRKRAACAAGREATNLDFDPTTNKFIVYGCSYSPASDPGADPSLRRPFLAGEFSPDQPQDFLRIWQNDAAWAIYRQPIFKSSACHACDYYRRQQCVGSCPIQNIDYSAITAGEDVLARLRLQLSQTAEWYCYQHVAGEL